MTYASKEECDSCLAKVAEYFFRSGDEETAKLLAQSSLEFVEEYVQMHDDFRDRWYQDSVYFHNLYVPPKLHKKIFDDVSQNFKNSLNISFNAVGIKTVNYRLIELEYSADWRKRLGVEPGHQVSNQANYTGNKYVYQGMKFGSPPEIEIAKVLENKGIMYFPNALVRAGMINDRQTRFPDFLIHNKGKWGILEVDGQTYHTSQSATKDHERTQLLQMHGKLYFARYDARRCMNNSEGVVSEFLVLLDNNG